MDYHDDDVSYRNPEDSPDFDYADTLARGDWLLVQSDWGYCAGSSAGASPGADPIAELLHDVVGIWHWGRSEHYDFIGKGAGTWAATAADVVKWGAKYPHLAEAWPTTPEEADLRLRRLIPALQAEPSPFWDPGFTEWYIWTWDSDGPSSMRYKDAYLHAELWRHAETHEEIYVFVAMRPWDMYDIRPRRAMDRAVYRRVCSLRAPEPDIDENDDFLL